VPQATVNTHEICKICGTDEKYRIFVVKLNGMTYMGGINIDKRGVLE
jgi:hypothetical protein